MVCPLPAAGIRPLCGLGAGGSKGRGLGNGALTQNAFTNPFVSIPFQCENAGGIQKGGRPLWSFVGVRGEPKPPGAFCFFFQNQAKLFSGKICFQQEDSLFFYRASKSQIPACAEKEGTSSLQKKALSIKNWISVIRLLGVPFRGFGPGGSNYTFFTPSVTFSPLMLHSLT